MSDENSIQAIKNELEVMRVLLRIAEECKDGREIRDKFEPAWKENEHKITLEKTGQLRRLGKELAFVNTSGGVLEAPHRVNESKVKFIEAAQKHIKHLESLERTERLSFRAIAGNRFVTHIVAGIVGVFIGIATNVGSPYFSAYLDRSKDIQKLDEEISARVSNFIELLSSEYKREMEQGGGGLNFYLLMENMLEKPTLNSKVRNLHVDLENRDLASLLWELKSKVSDERKAEAQLAYETSLRLRKLDHDMTYRSHFEIADSVITVIQKEYSRWLK